MVELIRALQELILTVRKNGIASLWTILILLALIFCYNIKGNVESFLERNPTPETQKERFSQTLIANNLIKQRIEQDRVKINSDRFLIRLFQDSKPDAVGLPFSSIQTVYAAQAPGITLEAGAMDPFPISTMNDILSEMWKGEPHCIKSDPKDITDPTYLRYLKDNGVALGYACPLLGLSGQPIGIIGAGYLTKEKVRPSDEVIFKDIEDTSIRIAGYISNVPVNDKEPWYIRLLDKRTRKDG